LLRSGHTRLEANVPAASEWIAREEAVTYEGSCPTGKGVDAGRV
jgi:hypothetical protein